MSISNDDARLIALIDERISHALEALTDKLDKSMNAGFPDGDPHGHRLYHEKEILKIQARIKMWEGIKEKTLAGAIWTLLMFIGTAVYSYMRANLHV